MGLPPASVGCGVSSVQVRLVGNGRATLSAPNGSSLLTLAAGAPPVSLHGFVVHGQITVHSGVLRMDNCTLEGGHSVDGGALMLTGGRMEANDTLFVGNVAARNGGAVHVAGGLAQFDGCRFERNSAVGDGGALYVESGSVVLRAGSLLVGNLANVGNSVFIVNGTVDYILPCPLGRYIDVAKGTSILSGATDLDYPPACVPGMYGNSYSPSAQSTPQCQGQCPSGFFCPFATATPIVCGPGNYCPGVDATGERGAASRIPCPAGTYSTANNSHSVAQCIPTTAGFYAIPGSVEQVACSAAQFPTPTPHPLAPHHTPYPCSRWTPSSMSSR